MRKTHQTYLRLLTRATHTLNLKNNYIQPNSSTENQLDARTPDDDGAGASHTITSARPVSWVVAALKICYFRTIPIQVLVIMSLCTTSLRSHPVHNVMAITHCCFPCIRFYLACMLCWWLGEALVCTAVQKIIRKSLWASSSIKRYMAALITLYYLPSSPLTRYTVNVLWNSWRNKTMLMILFNVIWAAPPDLEIYLVPKNKRIGSLINLATTLSACSRFVYNKILYVFYIF